MDNDNSWSNPQDTIKKFKKTRKRKREEADHDLSIGSLESSQSISDLYPIDFSHLINQHLSTSTPRADPKRMPVERMKRSSIPVDLRLGTKVRLTMKTPFPWMDKVGATGSYKVPITDDDIYLAMEMRVRGVPNEVSIPATAFLQAAASYHQFPCIYGVPVFPRLQSSGRSSMGGQQQINLQYFGPNFVETINEEWKESITNLYRLWKSGRRQSFYCLSPSFTIMFAKSQRSGEGRVVVTPTTSGFRQVLKEKRIEFSLPLKADLLFVDLDRDDCPRDFQPLDEDGTVDLDHDEWLRNIGISPRRTLRLSRASALDNTNGSSNGKAVSNLFGNNNHSDDDDSQESSRTTILISGGEANIDAFFQFFLDSKVGNTRSGPHSGLPSTLVASEPFHRSALRQLKISSHASRRDGANKYTLELSDGPVLPCVPGALMRFIERLFPRDEVSGETLKLQVNGRAPYSGFNEAIGYSAGGPKEIEVEKDGGEGLPINLFELEFNFAAYEFSW